MIPSSTVEQIKQITSNRITDAYLTPSVYQQEMDAVNGVTFDYQKYKAELDKLESDWAPEREAVTKNRMTRMIDIDVQSMRTSGKLAKDETVIPNRIIDNNIRRELPAYISYLIQSRRACIFKAKGKTANKQLNVEPLESEFTRVFRYTGWENVFYKTLDGACTHGTDAVEICTDSNMPGRLMNRHIGRDKLLYDKNAVHIQACSKIIVELDLSVKQLKKFQKKYGWDEASVNKLLQEGKEQVCFDKVFHVKKVFFHVDTDEYVRVAYYHSECDNWLSAPTPLFLGRKEVITEQTMEEVPIGVMPDGTVATSLQPKTIDKWVDVYETQYPVVLLSYSESESPKILDRKGRVYYDKFKQEAATAIRSSIVNTAVRSSNVYASPKQPTGTGTGIPKITVNTLVPGHIYDNGIDFWSLPSVDQSLLKVDQFLDATNSSETNQVAWAVNNREDSRKTATEVASAGRKEAEINTVQVTLFSTFLRELCEYWWPIVKSLALQDAIDFLSNVPLEQRSALLIGVYDLAAAGDVDVIKRDENLNKMRTDWPVISNTPLAPIFLSDYLRQSYPDKGEQYAQQLMAEMAQQQAAASQQNALLTALTGMVEQFKEQLTPEQQQQLANVIQAATPKAQ